MTNFKSALKIVAIILVAALVFCESAIAKKVLGYTPPSYFVRFLISIFTLAPIGFVVGGLSYYSARYFDYENCTKNRGRFFILLMLIILIGSFAGASDGLNDECWNPAMIGSVALSLIIPMASLILHRRLKLAPRLIISFVIFLPSLVIMEVVTYSYQMYSYFELGWPTAW